VDAIAALYEAFVLRGLKTGGPNAPPADDASSTPQGRNRR
jgi:hypothetical protein